MSGRVGTMSLATSCDITRHHAIGSGSGSGAGGVRCHSTEGVAEESRGGGSGSGRRAGVGSGRRAGVGSGRGSPYTEPHLNCWHATMKSHPDGELLCVSWAPFELLIHHHEIPSRMWVAVCLLASIWIADMPSWNHIQLVSCCMLAGLHLNF